jgi:hypothetical protein
MAVQSYQIATGWNNEAGYTNIEDIAVTGATPVYAGVSHYMVNALGGYRRGEPRFDIAGGKSYAGRKRKVWVQTIMTHLAFEHLKDTFEGQVTVHTPTSDPTTFEDWNAYLSLPEEAELTKQDPYFVNVEWTFLLVEPT